VLPDDKQPEPVRSSALRTTAGIFVSRHSLNIIDKVRDWGELDGQGVTVHFTPQLETAQALNVCILTFLLSNPPNGLRYWLAPVEPFSSCAAVGAQV